MSSCVCVWFYGVYFFVRQQKQFIEKFLLQIKLIVTLWRLYKKTICRCWYILYGLWRLYRKTTQPVACFVLLIILEIWRLYCVFFFKLNRSKSKHENKYCKLGQKKATEGPGTIVMFSSLFLHIFLIFIKHARHQNF